MRSGCTQDEACGSHGSCHIRSGTCDCTDGYTQFQALCICADMSRAIRIVWCVQTICHNCNKGACYTDTIIDADDDDVHDDDDDRNPSNDGFL